MQKKLLILEDNLYTAEILSEEITYTLSSHNIYNVEILVTNSIEEANEKIEQIDPKKLKCIIIDLNMNPIGLSIAEQRETHGATLTGWIWAYKYIIKKSGFKKTNIVFYSAFIDKLIKNSQYQELSLKEKNRITLVDKNGMGNLNKKVLKLL